MTKAQKKQQAEGQLPQMIYKSTIKKEFGLTEREIERLGEPDKVVKNPHYRSKSAYLYALDRVAAFASSIGK